LGLAFAVALGVAFAVAFGVALGLVVVAAKLGESEPARRRPAKERIVAIRVELSDEFIGLLNDFNLSFG
jgi:hypothetical protein